MEAVGPNPRSSSNAIARRARRGFNLIEAAVVLGVVGLVIGGIWIAASSLAQRRFEQQFMEGLLVLNDNLNIYFSQQSPCTGSYLYYSDPELWENMIYPKQWVAADVGNKINGPSVMLECPVNQPKYFSVVFWGTALSPMPRYVQDSLAPRVATLEKNGITQYYEYNNPAQNWTIFIPITRNNF